MLPVAAGKAVAPARQAVGAQTVPAAAVACTEPAAVAAAQSARVPAEETGQTARVPEVVAHTAREARPAAEGKTVPEEAAKVDRRELGAAQAAEAARSTPEPPAEAALPE